MIAEDGQSIFDVLLQEYGTIEDLWLLVDANAEYFKDEVTRIPVAGDDLEAWEGTGSEPRLQAYFKDKRINTGMTVAGAAGDFSYEVIPIGTVEAGSVAVLQMTITNPTADLVADYVYIDWGEGIEQQSFLLKDGATTDIESSFIVPPYWGGVREVSIRGAINTDVEYEVGNWILLNGVWNDEAGWDDEGEWNDNL